MICTPSLVAWTQYLIPQKSAPTEKFSFIRESIYNSINSQRFRKSNRALIETFESKITSISEMYLKAQIFVRERSHMTSAAEGEGVSKC